MAKFSINNYIMFSRTKQSLIRWWAIVCLQLLSFGMAGYFGVFQELWAEDATKLSFVILSIWLATTLWIGVWQARFVRVHVDYLIKIGWFLSEVCLALGMIGTVAGFLLMLGTAFSGIDVSNTATLQSALTSMATGMSTALYTTLTGLVCALYIKAQLVNLEHLLDQKKSDATNRQI